MLAAGRQRRWRGGRTDLGAHKTRVISAASHLTDDLHRLLARNDGEVAWVDGTRRNVRLRLSPIDVGPVLSATLWGEVTAVLTSATVPPFLVERVGLEGVRDQPAQCGKPLRLPGPLTPLRGPSPARPPSPAGRGRPPCRACPVDRRRRRADLGPVHQPPGDRRGRGRPGARSALPAAAPGRAAQGTTPGGVRAERDLVPLRHARLLAGRRHPRAVALLGDVGPVAVPPAR